MKYQDVKGIISEPPQRPIDRLRDSALSMAIDSPDDKSGIVATFEADSRLCIVTGSAVYAIQLSDGAGTN